MTDPGLRLYTASWTLWLLSFSNLQRRIYVTYLQSRRNWNNTSSRTGLPLEPNWFASRGRASRHNTEKWLAIRNQRRKIRWTPSDLHLCETLEYKDFWKSLYFLVCAVVGMHGGWVTGWKWMVDWRRWVTESGGLLHLAVKIWSTSVGRTSLIRNFPQNLRPLRSIEVWLYQYQYYCTLIMYWRCSRAFSKLHRPLTSVISARKKLVANLAITNNADLAITRFLPQMISSRRLCYSEECL